MDEGYGTRHWPKLREAGVPALLRTAASVWDDYEFCQYVHFNKSDKTVDTFGALHLAAGAKTENLYDIPRNKEGTLSATIAFVESAIDGDLYAWNDAPGRTKEDAARLLNRLADELETTI